MTHPTPSSESAEMGAADAQPKNELCLVCDKPHGFQWTDTHGVGVCYHCGAPYTIFHYDADKQRIDKPPECALTEVGLAIAKRYWKETGRMVFPGAYDMGILGHREATYSGATQSDISAFTEWAERQPEYAARSEAA